MLATRAEILIAMGKATSISDADLALLDMVHPLAESVLKNWLQQNLALATIVEFLPIGLPSVQPDTLMDSATVDFTSTQAVFRGNTPAGSEALQLKHLPVSPTGLEVREDLDANAGQASGAFGSESILTAGDDYWLDIDATGISRTGLLYRNGEWPTIPRCVKVTYLSGWTDSQLNGDAAGAIKLAAIETVAAAFKREKDRQGTGILTSEKIGKYGYTRDPRMLADSGGLNSGLPHSAMMMLQPFRNFGRLYA